MSAVVVLTERDVQRMLDVLQTTGYDSSMTVELADGELVNVVVTRRSHPRLTEVRPTPRPLARDILHQANMVTLDGFDGQRVRLDKSKVSCLSEDKTLNGDPIFNVLVDGEWFSVPCTTFNKGLLWP